MRYFTSDTHFNHPKTAEMRGYLLDSAPHRDEIIDLISKHPAAPFIRWSLDDAAFHDSIGLPYTETGDTIRHDDEVIASINAVVGRNDELWIIGDATDGDFSVLDRIECDRINLVVGNHDACFYDRSKLVEYLDAFDTVHEDYAVLDDFPGFEGHTVKLCHFPYGEHDYKVTGELPIPTRDTDALVYGHMHYTNCDRWRDEMALHAGWDAWHRPVSEEEIGSILSSWYGEQGEQE